MTTTTHRNLQPSQGLHGIVGGLGPYTNEAARIGATVAATDIGKVALQSDVGSGWVLTNNSPVTWAHAFGPPPVHTETTTARTLGAIDYGAYLRCTNAGATTITVPLQATVPCSPGTQALIAQKGAGQVLLAPVSGTVVLLARSSLFTKAQNGVLCAFFAGIISGSEVWDVFGDEQ